MEEMERFLNRVADEMLGNKITEARGLLGVRQIKVRTRQWMDIFGKRFKPYSERHRQRRVALGLPIRPQGENTDSILVMHPIGGMMDKIESNVGAAPGKAVLDIMDAEKKKLASYHNILGVGKAGKNLRQFWGFTDDEVEQQRDFVETQAQTVLENLVAQMSPMVTTITK